MDRRSFIQFLAALGATTSSGFIWPRQVIAAQPDLEVDLKAVQDRVPLFSGPPTDVWRLKGQVLHGDHWQLQNSENSWLGPAFRVQKGQRKQQMEPLTQSKAQQLADDYDVSYAKPQRPPRRKMHFTLRS
ncbi:MAG: hypothetical protein ACLFT5_08160 [Desulfovermiculus sp.]